jgi:glutamate synthase domain-containing protein 2
LEFSNYIGTPLVNGLTYVYDALVGFGLKQHIKLFASGKVVTGFDVVRLLCLGADACNSARAMMMAIGCIQALRCNTNRCPSGVATQDPVLNEGIDVPDKKWRVANYHYETIKSVKEILLAAGLSELSQLNRNLISKKIRDDKIVTLDEIFPYVEEGCLLKNPYPKIFQKDMPIENQATRI